MTKGEWAFVRQLISDVAGYAEDARKYLRGNPGEDKARVALQRLCGARAALDAAESKLRDYVEREIM